MTTTEALRAEILEIWKAHPDISMNLLVHTLNGPARVQQRGVFVDEAMLVAVIINDSVPNDSTRWIVISDQGSDELLTTEMFMSYVDAANWGDTSGLHGIIKRIDL